MISKTTEYKIATTYDEYVGCHDLMKKDEELSYPTVMAVRDGKAIGMIGTARGKENLFATPIIANSIFTCIGLYELYERTLSNLGTKHYLFSVERKNIKLINAVERLFEIKPFMKTDEQLFYARRI
ncbi:MAG: hypothetical protein V3U84_03680 [Thiotrichaceae bacterium]